MDKKHLELLDFLLVQLCKGRPSGILFRYILNDYKKLTGIVFTYQEQTNFIDLYKDVYFTKENIDRLKIAQSARTIINEFGSLTEYLNSEEREKQVKLESENQSFLLIKEIAAAVNNPKENPARKMTKGEIWAIIIAIVSIGVTIYIAYRQGIFE